MKKLNSQRFVELIADLLWRDGHSNLKIVDGPGDGCRDIHSKTKNGKKHIAQCKFYNNPSRTVSSREIGELPLGMIKLDYKEGLFATNARISPQAKREFLNDYPYLNLNFIEGKEVTRKVFNDLILMALWYDGKSIDKISYQIIIPLIARDLLEDKPIPLIDQKNKMQLGKEVLILEDGKTSLQVQLREKYVDSSIFEPYRPPITETRRESELLQLLLSTETTIEGINLLEELESSVNSVCSFLINRLKNNIRKKPDYYIALRLGLPYILPLGGRSHGTHIGISIPPVTFILQNNSKYSESEWILPSPKSNWYPPEIIRASQRDWVRWYNPHLDACLNMYIESPPDRSTRKTLERQREFFIEWWKKSLFAVIPGVKITLLQKFDIPEPTFAKEWNRDGIFCAWLHENLTADFIIARLDREGPVRGSPNSHRLEKLSRQLQNQISNMGGRIVQPEKARHMLAFLDHDPYPSIERISYHSVDLLEDLKMIPSPIDPRSRQFEFELCWQIKAKDINEMLISNIEEQISNKIKSKHSEITCTVYFDLEAIRGMFMIVNLGMYDNPGHEQTDIFLGRIEPILKLAMNDIENIIRHYVDFKRATKTYWKTEIGLIFP